MKFTCRGQLANAEVPAGVGPKSLAYWQVSILPQTIEFRPQTDDTCGLGERRLAMGVQTKVPFVPQSVEAVLGFHPNGNLVTYADNYTNLDSRFALPEQLQLQGSGSSTYPLTTVSQGYFNNWAFSDKPASGFFNIVGKLRVPFFSDIKVHLQLAPQSATLADLHIMGGWPANSGQADFGWSVAGNNFFTQSKFDPSDRGWPLGLALQDYQSNTNNDFLYRPRAQCHWIEAAVFDYPLKWDNLLHEFASYADAPVRLPIIDVNSRLKSLSPGRVDLDFAQDLSVQLPRIKMLDLQNAAQQELSKPVLAVSNALYSALNQAFNTAGINQLQKALRGDAGAFFRPVLKPLLDPLIDPIFNSVDNYLQTDPQNVLQDVYAGIATDAGGLLKGALQDVNTASNLVGSVGQTLDQALTDVDDSINLMVRLLTQRDSNNNRELVKILIQKLFADQAQDYGFAADAIDSHLDEILADLEPTIQEIVAELQDLKSQVEQVQGTLKDINGDFSNALGELAGDVNLFQNYLQLAGNLTTNYLGSVLKGGRDYLSANVDGAKAAIEDQLTTAFVSSVLPTAYQTTFRSFLADDNFLLNQIMESLFGRIDQELRDALQTAFSTATDQAFAQMKGSGLLGQSLLSAKIRGAPTFNGDSLDNIHLDARVQLKVPEPMEFNAYMDIKRLNSQSVPQDCIPSGAPAAEVTLGTKNVPLNWPGVGSNTMTISLDARWTLQGGNVIGVGGGLQLDGTADLETCEIKNLGAQLAIGDVENYFAGHGQGTVTVSGIPLQIQAGLFAGKACSPLPLKSVDPEADQVVPDINNFSGLYVQGGAGLSLSDLIFHSSSCVLDVEAHQNVAVYWAGGPLFGKFGGREKMAIDASLLCLVSGSASWSEFFRVQTSPAAVTIGAAADFCGKVGYCPFCGEICKTLRISGTVGSRGIDYSLDY